ncbi:hypothetical protein T11_10867 [Trichinella zimbabwensis]|uniref:Uncharacterized protein n=1 Tax=Trichinella zimbabwensis TaxID=268475 RepID=A0A0V1GU03_9BILA|nr:hypothetical protein T11_10867 [Trichinella zimbabwensis]
MDKAISGKSTCLNRSRQFTCRIIIQKGTFIFRTHLPLRLRNYYYHYCYFKVQILVNTLSLFTKLRSL